jgi:hypothetical protein
MAAVKGPFTYEALKPEEIEFIPLNQTKKMNGKQLMEFYEVRAIGIVKREWATDTTAER